MRHCLKPASGPVRSHEFWRADSDRADSDRAGHCHWYHHEFTLGMEHQDPFWLPDIVVGIKKIMWGDSSDDETGIFFPDLLSLVSKCAHQMDIMGLDGAYKRHMGRQKADVAP